MKKPFLHALSASAYIFVLILGIGRFENVSPDQSKFLAPIAMLSLLVFSVAFMAFVFFYEPLQLYMNGQKSEALSFFGKTLASFAVLTLVVIVLLFLV